MEKSEHQGAINLTSVRDSAESLPNGDIVRNGDSTEESKETGSQSPTDQPVAAKRKIKSNSAIETGNGIGGIVGQQVMMAAQQGLINPQQIQQLLLQQPSTDLKSTQLQQLMQHQSMVLQHQQQQKLQEQVIQELNEQLQMNMLQQSKLMQQPDKVKNSKTQQQQLTQLAVQQQQLVQQIQQIQLQQRQFLLACLTQPFVGVNQGMMSPVEIQQLWKEVAAQSGLQEESKVHFNGLTSTRSQTPTSQALPTWTNGVANHLSQPSISGQPSRPPPDEDEEPKFTTLYRHGLCKWPGCDMQCETYKIFLRHINEEHHLDDRSTAQARVQMQVVSQLEIQLTREKELLQEMMRHLHMKPNDSKNGNSSEIPKPRVPTISTAADMPTSPLSSSTLSSLSVPSPPKMTSVLTSPTKLQPNVHMSASAPPTPVSLVSHQISLPIVIPSQLGPASISKPPTPQSHSMSQPSTPTSIGPMRRRVSDKCNLPISAEIQRNREFYKNTDVRPPFTYASLIRQAIIESQHKQLTLNEIYQWFQTTFSYFRRNEATWKNAVRHNLSLHKCFMRVENVKGAVWTVDEIEFYKRRPQKLGGNIGMKDMPSPGSDPTIFGDNLNASLRAAIEQANIQFMNNQNYSNGDSSLDGAEDLSMKSSRNDSSESLSKFEFPSREEYMMMKHEVQDNAFDENENNGHLGDGNHREEEIMDSDIDNIPQEIVEVKTEQSPVQSPKHESQIPTNQEIYSNLLQKAQESNISTVSNPITS